MRKLKPGELGRFDPEQYKGMPKLDVVLILDNIRSGLNVGAFFRTADAFMISRIYLTGISATPPNKEINKTAIGADHTVDWTYIHGTEDAIIRLKAEGYQIIGIEQTDESISLRDFTPDPSKKTALVFGNEVDGLSDGIMNMLDLCLEIPQFGTKHSLNVSVSGGIVIWDVFQKLFLKS